MLFFSTLLLANLIDSRIESNYSTPLLTSEFGTPIDDDLNSETCGANGPNVLSDFHFLNKLSHFDRERIPERVVHAKGTGVKGYFVFDGDEQLVKSYTKAKLFKKHKTTHVFARFSFVSGNLGTPDSTRDPRGFALKFYTDDGNWDIVGNNIPVFFINDPIKFPDFIHSQKRDSKYNLKNYNTRFDFFSRTPESLNTVTRLYTHEGLTDALYKMNGYSVNAFKAVNHNGDWVYCKFNYESNQGIEGITSQEANRRIGIDYDYDRKRLYSKIEAGMFPTWNLTMDILNPQVLDSTKYKNINFLDDTILWPNSTYTTIRLGKIVLNQIPDNFFAYTEQVAFCPANIIPGIQFSEDKVLNGRAFSYADTQRYRLGVNYAQLPVNSPKNSIFNYQRDGFMVTTKSFNGIRNYNANGYTRAYNSTLKNPKKISGYRGAFSHGLSPLVFSDARTHLESVGEKGREYFVDEISMDLAKVDDNIRERFLVLLRRANKQIVARIKAKVHLLKKAETNGVDCK